MGLRREDADRIVTIPETLDPQTLFIPGTTTEAVIAVQPILEVRLVLCNQLTNSISNIVINIKLGSAMWEPATNKLTSNEA
jgi:hypothetical protein